jgi:hypothetical protein
MDEALKLMIREEVANGNLTAILLSCASECNYQTEQATSSGETRMWAGLEEEINYVITRVEQGAFL